MEVDDTETIESLSIFERLIDILEKPLYSKSTSNIEQILTMLERTVAPLSHIPKDCDRGVELNSRVHKDLFFLGFLRSIHTDFYIEH